MVTMTNLDRLRRLNFGIRNLREPVTADVLVREIGRYDPQDTASVSRQMRASASRNAVIEEILTLYQEVLTEHGNSTSKEVEAEFRAASAYLSWLTPYLRQRLSAKVAFFLLLKVSYKWLQNLPLLGSLVQSPTFVKLSRALAWKVKAHPLSDP
jgi:hypothetical protein